MTHEPPPPPSLRVLAARSTLGELAGINTTILNDGALVYVTSNRDVYALLKDSTDAPDGSNVVASLAGPGRWFKTGLSQSSWQTQTDWYVDEQNATGLASDSNTGDTATTPLLSYAELTRRIEFATLEQTTTVHLISDVNPDSVFRFRGSVPFGSLLVLRGEAAVIEDTITLTAVQDIVVGTTRPFVQKASAWFGCHIVAPWFDVLDAGFLVGCNLDLLNAADVYVGQSLQISGSLLQGVNGFVRLQSGGEITIVGDSLHLGSCHVLPGVTLRVPAALGLRDWPEGAGLRVYPRGGVDATSRIWGISDEADTYGIQVQSGGFVDYTTKPNAVGTLSPGQDVDVGGTTLPYAALPHANPTNMASIVERASP